MKNGAKVVLVDDLLATGGTLKATRELMSKVRDLLAFCSAAQETGVLKLLTPLPPPPPFRLARRRCWLSWPLSSPRSTAGPLWEHLCRASLSYRRAVKSLNGAARSFGCIVLSQMLKITHPYFTGADPFSISNLITPIHKAESRKDTQGKPDAAA